MAKLKEDTAAEATVEAAPAEPTKAELQDELRDAGLPVSGTKAELVDRVATVETTDGGTLTVAPVGQCVVDDGTVHVGRAVNGKVCSAHANRYRPDGTAR